MRLLVDFREAQRVAAAARGEPLPAPGVGLGVRDLRWIAPVRPGDVITYSTADRVDARDQAAAMGDRRLSRRRRRPGGARSLVVFQSRSRRAARQRGGRANGKTRSFVALTPKAAGRAPSPGGGSAAPHRGATRYLTNPPGAGPIGVSATLDGGGASAAAGEVANVATTWGGHGVNRQLPSDFGSMWRVATM